MKFVLFLFPLKPYRERRCRGAMAAAVSTNDLLKSLRDAVNCSVCQNVFTDPVTLDCGHNFCHSCIIQCWEGFKGDFPCPRCRKRFRKGTMRPNPQLEEIAKQVRAPAVKQSEEEKLCQKHKKPLNLYCWEDGYLICETCDLSFDFRDQRVLTIEDAAKELKDEYQKAIQDDTSKKEARETFKLNEEKKIAALLTKTETERQKIVSYFVRQHQNLKEEEQRLVGELEEMEKIIQKSKDECFAKLSKEIAHYDKHISKRKKWCQKTAIKVCMNDDDDTDTDKFNIWLWNEFPDPKPISPELEITYSNFYKTFKVLKDAVIIEREDVTLDPETAHPTIAVGEDGRSARKVSFQTVPNSPKRFDAVLAVLGSEGFTSGSHCWEAEVELGEDWAVGIATESVKRKELCVFDPFQIGKFGIWSVWMIQNKAHPSYWAAAATIPDPAIPVPTIPAPPTPIATIQAPVTTVPALATPIARIQAPIPVPDPAASYAAALTLTSLHTASPDPAASYAAAPVLAASCGAAPAASYLAPPATAMPMASNRAMVWTSTTMQAPSAILTETLAPTSQSKPSIKIRVCLDYNRGWVTFHRSDNMAPSFTYCATFTEKIFPFFWLWSEGAWVRLCP